MKLTDTVKVMIGLKGSEDMDVGGRYCWNGRNVIGGDIIKAATGEQ